MLLLDFLLNGFYHVVFCHCSWIVLVCFLLESIQVFVSCLPFWGSAVRALPSPIVFMQPLSYRIYIVVLCVHWSIECMVLNWPLSVLTVPISSHNGQYPQWDTFKTANISIVSRCCEDSVKHLPCRAQHVSCLTSWRQARHNNVAYSMIGVNGHSLFLHDIVSPSIILSCLLQCIHLVNNDMLSYDYQAAQCGDILVSVGFYFVLFVYLG